MLKQLGLWTCFAFTLTACTASYKPHSTAKIKHGEMIVSYTTIPHKSKSATAVAIYSKASLVNHPYRVIGQETVSRYNLIGMERKPLTVNHIMKDLAASIGGDAIMDVTEDGTRVEGTIISFEKVLL